MLEIPIGDAFVLSVVIEDPDTGLPVDITDAKVMFTLKKTLLQEDADAPLKKDITIHSDPINGTTEIPLTNADTSIASGEYYWSLRVVFQGGEILTAVPGEKMAMIPHSTKRIV